MARNAGAAQPWLGVSAAWGAYVAGAVCVAWAVGERVAPGWGRRLAVIGCLAVGLFPARHWLGPRVTGLLSRIGFIGMVACYFVVLAPFAAIAKWSGWRHGAAATNWMPRRTLPAGLEAARLEW